MLRDSIASRTHLSLEFEFGPLDHSSSQRRGPSVTITELYTSPTGHPPAVWLHIIYVSPREVVVDTVPGLGVPAKSTSPGSVPMILRVSRTGIRALTRSGTKS